MTLPESAYCLDRRVVNPPASFNGASTSWSLPYTITAGRATVCLLDTGEELACTQAGSTVTAAGNYAGRPVAVGIVYDFRFTPSTIYPRGDDGMPDRRAKLTLRVLKAHLDGTRALSCTLAVPGRTPYTGTVRWDDPPAGQQFVFPVLATHTDAAIEFHSETPFPIRIGSLEWEGQFHTFATRRTP